MNEGERLDRLLQGYEDELLVAADEEFEVAAEEQIAAGIVGSVLIAYGYQRDGSRLPNTWRRERISRRLGRSRPQSRARIAAEPLRASFSPPRDDTDEGGDEGGER